MTFTPDAVLALATLLFCMGIVGVVSRRSLFVLYLSVELMLNAVNLVLALFSRVQNQADGSVIALLMIGVIAAEAGLFLAMIVQLYRKGRTVDPDAFDKLAQRNWS